MFTMDQGGACVELASAVPTAIIGAGGDSKNSICVVRGCRAILTPPTGSLADVDEYRRFTRRLEELALSSRGNVHLNGVVESESSRGFAIDRASIPPAARGGRGVVAAHDLHPAYLSTLAARKLASVRSPDVVRIAQWY